jgi:glutaredoxin-related protein
MKNNLKVTMYGAMWCPDTLRALEFLTKNKIEVDFKDIDNNPENTKTVEDLNNGMRIIPSIIFPDGTLVVEPSNSELEKVLSKFN